MKQDKTNIGSQTAKERETVRQLFRGGLYLTIVLVILFICILAFIDFFLTFATSNN